MLETKKRRKKSQTVLKIHKWSEEGINLLKKNVNLCVKL